MTAPGPRTPDSPGAVSAVALVAGREIRERLRARSYLALTALLMVGIVGMGVFARIVGADDGPEPARVAVAGPTSDSYAAAAVATGDAVDRPIEIVTTATAEEARAGVEDGEIDAAVSTGERTIVFDDEVDEMLVTVLQQAWIAEELRADLDRAGLDDEALADVLRTEPLEVERLEPTDDGADDDELALLTGTLVSVMLFLSLQVFGSYVLIGVVEEKSTAVVELLLARIRADQLLAGKVIGIGTTALLQFAAAAAAGAVALAISGVDVPGEIWATLPVAVLWFLGGYAFYSTLYALAGSLVSRQEDAQAAAAPVLTVMLAAYFAVFVLGSSPESTASTVLSLLPPFAPFIMPVRMAAGAASAVEVAVSLALLAEAVLGVWWLAGAIYRQVLLRRGSRIPWKDAWTMLRAAPLRRG